MSSQIQFFLDEKRTWENGYTQLVKLLFRTILEVSHLMLSYALPLLTEHHEIMIKDLPAACTVRAHTPRCLRISLALCFCANKLLLS